MPVLRCTVDYGTLRVALKRVADTVGVDHAHYRPEQARPPGSCFGREDQDIV